jgi:NTP pyrophosphatase (non-canonical NTP hydrolase)
MNMDEYQLLTRKTALYPRDHENYSAQMAYLTLGMVGEAGEVANRYKKVVRDDNYVISTDAKNDILAELGDVLWYLARIADELGCNLSEIGESNIEKLLSRAVRGKLGGSGDNR